MTASDSVQPGWWHTFWNRPVRAESLALLRICMVGCLLADQLLQFLPNLATFFGPDGNAPAGINDAYLASNWRWTILLFHTDNMTVVWIAFAAWMAVTLLFLLGWQTRLMSILTWFGTLCFLNRNPNLNNGGDDVMQVALFLLMFSPCGVAFSLDALRRKSRGKETSRYIHPWSVRLFQIQLCMIYLTTGIAKLGGTTWLGGESVYNVLNDITLARWSYSEMALPYWITVALSYSTLLFEVGFLFGVLWKKTRWMFLYGGLAFHIGIYVTIEVGWFSFYTMAMYAVWIPDWWWERRDSNQRVQSTTT